MHPKTTAGLLACVLLPFCVQAEDEPTVTMEPVIVTESRVAEPLARALSSVVLITREEIERAGQMSLPELLQVRGGVEIGSNGGAGQTASVFIRGANSAHTVVLVDGVRLTNVTTGTTALEHIPLAQIERIEILRGPGSSLYGSEAIGGVIQIFTRRGQTSGWDTAIGFGEWNTFRGEVGGRVATADTTLDVRLAHESTEGFSATNAPTWAFDPDRDPYRNVSANLALERRLDERSRLGLSAFVSEGTAHFDAGATTDPVKVEKLGSVSAYFRYRMSDRWESQLRASLGVDDYRFQGVNYDPVKSSVRQLSWQNDLRAGPGRLVAGLEGQWERLSTPTGYALRHRDNGAFFALYRVESGPYAGQVSLRHDQNSQFGGHTTGALGAGLELGRGLRLTGNLGTAFRAPSFADLYYPRFGNPDLRPERAIGGEIALAYRDARAAARATWFANRIRDLVAFDWGTTLPSCPWGCPVNIGRAKTEGLELEGRVLLDASWSATARATLQQAVNADTGRRLPRRAEAFAGAGLDWQGGPWRIGAKLLASGDRFDATDEAPSSRLPGYALLNLRARYAFSPELALEARWNNVFDRRYELVQGYATPGSNLFVGLRYAP